MLHDWDNIIAVMLMADATHGCGFCLATQADILVGHAKGDN
jgi:hypothetical protein